MCHGYNQEYVNKISYIQGNMCLFFLHSLSHLVSTRDRFGFEVLAVPNTQDSCFSRGKHQSSLLIAILRSSVINTTNFMSPLLHGGKSGCFSAFLEIFCPGSLSGLFLFLRINCFNYRINNRIRHFLIFYSILTHIAFFHRISSIFPIFLPSSFSSIGLLSSSFHVPPPSANISPSSTTLLLMFKSSSSVLNISSLVSRS